MTYDRYLVRSFLHTFGVCFIATFGLYLVIDLLENLDEMFELNKDASGVDKGPVSLFALLATLNSYRAILFFDLAGPVIAVISVMTVLILLQRSGELHPLLAAGIPMYRILSPIIFATVVVNCVLMLNLEFLVPRVAFLHHELRNRKKAGESRVESVRDLSTKITIDGTQVNVAKRTVEMPVFVLNPPLVKELAPVYAESAIYAAADRGRPAGWLLKNVSSPSIPELAEKLTDEGRKVVWVRQCPHVFIVSAITCDQLFKRSSSFASLSTLELLDRIHCPAFAPESIHRLVLYLHSRFLKPFLNIIAVLVTIPLMVRRESPGLVVDSSLCGLVLAVMFGVAQGFQSLGASHLVTPELAAWGPVVIGGSISAWLSGVIRT